MHPKTQTPNTNQVCIRRGQRVGVPWPRHVRAPLRAIQSSTYGKYSVGPSIRPIRTRCCFTMTTMIQVCSNFHRTLTRFVFDVGNESVYPGLGTSGHPYYPFALFNTTLAPSDPLVRTLHPTPYTLHPTPDTRHPTPDTRHPTP